MLDYNLTQRERQILIQLVGLAGSANDQFSASIADLAAPGPARELASIAFAPGSGSNASGEDRALELTKRDLRLLKDEGLIHFRWDAPDRGRGRLSSLAFEAVTSSFDNGEAEGAAAVNAAAAATAERSLIADEAAIALRLKKITLELVSLARELIDADEAQAAEHEALSIAEELGKDVPDETVITRKTKGFVSRLALTFSGTADLAAKGEMIGEYGERLAAWLVALSVWTEWRATHHTVPDPYA